MAASLQEVTQWQTEAKRRGATHLISVCDTFDYDDYPVYVMEGDNLEELKKRYSSNMQSINEIIEIQ